MGGCGGGGEQGCLERRVPRPPRRPLRRRTAVELVLRCGEAGAREAHLVVLPLELHLLLDQLSLVVVERHLAPRRLRRRRLQACDVLCELCVALLQRLDLPPDLRVPLLAAALLVVALLDLTLQLVFLSGVASLVVHRLDGVGIDEGEVRPLVGGDVPVAVEVRLVEELADRVRREVESPVPERTLEVRVVDEAAARRVHLLEDDTRLLLRRQVRPLLVRVRRLEPNLVRRRRRRRRTVAQRLVVRRRRNRRHRTTTRRRARCRKVLLRVDGPGGLRLEDVHLVVLVQLRAGDEVDPLQHHVVVHLQAVHRDALRRARCAGRLDRVHLRREHLLDAAGELADGREGGERELEVHLRAEHVGAHQKREHFIRRFFDTNAVCVHVSSMKYRYCSF
eukprot:Rhum_TRINITY_DN14331_c0_g2::Rhum_TRINITY_DN14331_c0_g2_i1::g.80466::m.80466